MYSLKKKGKKMYTDHIEWEAHLFWVLGRGRGGNMSLSVQQ